MAESLSALVKRVNALTARVATTEGRLASTEGRIQTLEEAPVIPPVIVVPTDGGTHVPPYPVVVEPGTPVPTPPAPSEFVNYPNAGTAFICGPQLDSGSAANPWPWFDTNAITRGLVHGAAFPASHVGTDLDAYINQNYYDQGLAQPINYHRTGNTAHLTDARKIADSWWASPWVLEGGQLDFESGVLAPRNASLGGLMLRALDGRPEVWPWLVAYVRAKYPEWLGSHLADAVLHQGVRDGGYMLLFCAWLAAAHPDSGVRAEMQAKALAAAKDYYARLQNADGGWYWNIEDGAGDVTAQPFMIGILMEGMIATHLLTGDATVRTSILNAVDWMWNKGYDTANYTNIAVAKRAMRYFVVKDAALSPAGSAALYGSPDGAVRDNRQLNPECLHAFGYAFKLTGDTTYLTKGDNVFAATFGNGQGPGSDAYYGLADYRAKEFNVSYRSAGRYLAWRAGA